VARVKFNGFLCPNANAVWPATLGDGRRDFMSEDQQQFMRLLGQLPARLTAEQAA
jgi:hypothetical protein